MSSFQAAAAAAAATDATDVAAAVAAFGVLRQESLPDPSPPPSNQALALQSFGAVGGFVGMAIAGGLALLWMMYFG